MLYESFKTVEKLDNVKYIGSNADMSPLHDASVTIFLKNDYRVISTKSVFGQSLEVENISDSNLPIYKSEVYHQFMNNISPPANKFYQEEQGDTRELDKKDFSEKVAAILGEAVYGYLTERHKSVAILTIYPSASPTSEQKMKVTL